MPVGSIPSTANNNNNNAGRAWWRTLVIPVLWEAETGGSEFAANLSAHARARAHDFSLFSLSLSPLSLSLSLSLPSEALCNFVRPGFKNKA